jgi:hypothetical protein
MTVELRPETEQLVQEEMRRGHFGSVDQMIVQGIYALREKSEKMESGVRTHKPRKSIFELLTEPPFAGSELIIDRLRDGPRPVDL